MGKQDRQVVHESLKPNMAQPEIQPDATAEAIGKLDTELSQAQSRLQTLQTAITAEGDLQTKMAQFAEITALTERIKAIPAQIESVKADAVHDTLLLAVQAAIDTVKDKLTVSKLYYENTIVNNADGTTAAKASLRINDVASVFGKRKAADGAKAGSKALIWQDKAGAKLNSTELFAKIKAQSPDVAQMVAGIAKNSTDRAIQAVQKKQLASLAWLADWSRANV